MEEGVDEGEWWVDDGRSGLMKGSRELICWEGVG